MIGSRWMDGLLLGADNEFHFVTAHLLQKGDDTAVCVPSSLHWNGSCTDQTRTQQRFYILNSKEKGLTYSFLSSKSIHSKNLTGRLSHFLQRQEMLSIYPVPQDASLVCTEIAFLLSGAWALMGRKLGALGRQGWWHSRDIQQGDRAGTSSRDTGQGHPAGTHAPQVPSSPSSSSSCSSEPCWALSRPGAAAFPFSSSPLAVTAASPCCPSPPHPSPRHLQSRWDVSDTGKGGGRTSAWVIPGTARPFKLCCWFENGFRAFPW